MRGRLSSITIQQLDLDGFLTYLGLYLPHFIIRISDKFIYYKVPRQLFYQVALEYLGKYNSMYMRPIQNKARELGWLFEGTRRAIIIGIPTNEAPIGTPLIMWTVLSKRKVSLAINNHVARYLGLQDYQRVTVRGYYLTNSLPPIEVHAYVIKLPSLVHIVSNTLPPGKYLITEINHA